jgi:hypothetical protein
MENNKADILKKLEKIKALAERGVGGEKADAMRMYEELKRKYEISSEDIAEQSLEKRWFSYKTELEKNLFAQVAYKVTGDGTCYQYTGKYARRKKIGVICTEIEAAEIQLLFNFYRNEMKKELETFFTAFVLGNDLYPDETARAYKEENKRDLTEDEINHYRKANYLAEFMDKKQPPRAAIEKVC